MRPKRPPPTLPKAPPPALNSSDQLEEDQFTAVAGPWWPPCRPRHASKPKPPPPLLPRSWMGDPWVTPANRASMSLGHRHVGLDWILAPVPEQVEMAKLVGENSVQLVAWYAEIPPSIVCLGWSCSKGNAVSEHLQRWFEHSLTASV